MAWDDEVTAMARVLVNDSAATKYSDDRINEAILMAMQFVQIEISFPQSYAIDLVNVTVTPDPTIEPDRDDGFITLVSVKTACIVDQGSAADAASQAIRVKDGASEVDLRDSFKAKMDLIKNGWCNYYEKLKKDYALGQRGKILGAAVMTPFRLFSGYGNDIPFGNAGGLRPYSR